MLADEPSPSEVWGADTSLWDPAVSELRSPMALTKRRPVVDRLTPQRAPRSANASE